MGQKYEPIWYEDISKFLTGDNYYLIIPMQSMTFEQKLNAIFRFFLYLGLILSFALYDGRYLFFPVIVAIIAIILNESNRSAKRNDEEFLEARNEDVVDNETCVRSTVNNPFMNVMYGDNMQRPKACNVLDKRIKAKIETNFNANLFRDVGDIWDRMSSQRQFYTMPSTTIPNDAIAFAEWCYGRPQSCKEGNGQQCSANMNNM